MIEPPFESETLCTLSCDLGAIAIGVLIIGFGFHCAIDEIEIRYKLKTKKIS